MQRKKQKRPENRVWVPALKSSIMAMIFTITGILVFALIVKSADLDDKAILVVNQIIKIAGVIFAAFFAAKDKEAKSILAAACAGLLYIVIGFIVFSIISGGLGDLMLMVTDSMMGVVIGMVVGLFVSKVMKKGKTT